MMNDVSNKQAMTPSVSFKYPVNLQVWDSSGIKKLAGAEFKLTYEAPETVQETLICDAEGKTNFTVNEKTIWTLEETKAPQGYQLNSTPIKISADYEGLELLEPTTVPFVELKRDEFILDGYVLTVKNTKIPTSPEDKTTKYVTNNSLTELVKLIKTEILTQSSKVLNVTVNHTIDTYTPMGTSTAKKKFYADIPCTKSKVTMNCDITPADSVEDAGLLTYAEPMEGKVRCYFMEEPAEAYTVEAIELTPVVSSVEVDVKEFLAGDVYAN